MSGSTDDLAGIARVAHGWAEGHRLDEIDRAAPFDLLTGRPEVPGKDRPAVVDAEWHWLLAEARRADRPEYRALVEAAHAEPRLRALFPMAEHWVLSFSADPFRLDSPDHLGLEAVHGTGTYTVRATWSAPVLRWYTGAREAVSFAVRLLPRDLGVPGV